MQKAEVKQSGNLGGSQKTIGQHQGRACLKIMGNGEGLRIVPEADKFLGEGQGKGGGQESPE